MFLLPRASRLSSRLRPLISQYGTQISSSTTTAPRLSRPMQISAVGYDENSPSSSSSSSSSSEHNTPSITERTSTPSRSVLESQITSHPLFKSLRQNSSFYETRPHETMDASLKPYHLVAGALAGPAKIPLPPYMFYSKASNELVSFFYIGPELCGHPGFVHGGLLSVMFDEVFARLAMPNFKSKLGVTANLSVDYRAPARPGEWYALKSRTVSVEGRKAWVEGKLEMLARGDGNGNEGEGESVVVAEGKSLFVEPKFADSMPSLYKS